MYEPLNRFNHRTVQLSVSAFDRTAVGVMPPEIVQY